MVNFPIVKGFKGLIGDILNLDTGSTFRQPHGNGYDTELVNFITDDPNHFCKDCKTAICKNCGREMNKRDLELGQNMDRKDLASLKEMSIASLEPNEYKEYINGRFNPLDKLDWFRKCKDSVTCEGYKNSKTEKKAHRIFSSIGKKSSIDEDHKYLYYDKEPPITPYKKTLSDPKPILEQCNRCGGDIKQKRPRTHPLWGNVCRDCSDVLKDGGF